MTRGVIACIILLTFPVTATFAQVGELDDAFGEGGIQTTNFKQIDAAYDLARQSDGRIVLVGYSEGSSVGTRDAQVARYLPDGTLEDSWTYSHGGFGCSNVPEEFRAVALGPDDMIVAGGYEQNDCGGPQRDFLVVRYRADGKRDDIFSQPVFKGGTDYLEDLAVQPDGKVVAVGRAKGLQTDNSDYDAAIVRYHPDGSLDGTFGSTGELLVDFFGEHDQARAVAVQPDGKILVTGLAENAGQRDIFLLRYDTHGTLDEHFGTQGIVTADIDGLNDIGFRLALQEDGKILVAGSREARPDTSRAMLLMRFHADGTLDTSFGSSGHVAVDFGLMESVATGLAVLDDGKFVLSGWAGAGEPNERDFAVARLHPDGTLDASFAGDGMQTSDVALQQDAGQMIAVQPDGNLLLAGSSESGDGGAATRDFALLRYQADTPPLEIVPHPSIRGRVTSGGSAIAGVAVRLTGSEERVTRTDADGRYVLSNLPPGGDYVVTPLRPEATFDPAQRSFSSLTSDTTVNYSVSLLPLNGGYTLGGDTPDFHTFVEAAHALNQQGIAGPVSINARAGLYSEGPHVVMNISDVIDGAGETNHVIFQPDEATGASVEDVILDRTPQARANLDGAVVSIRSSFVTLRQLTLRNGNTTSARNAVGAVVRLDRAGSNSRLDGMIIEGCHIDGGRMARDGVRITDSSRDLVFRDNTIDGATQGIYIRGSQHALIENNVMTGLATYQQTGSTRGSGINVDGGSHPIVRGNVLDYSNTNGQVGISLSATHYRIDGNQIVNVNSGGIYNSFTGIRVSTFNRSPTTGVIANNMVTVNTPRRSGIAITGSSQGGDDILIAHNTVYLPPRGIDGNGGSYAFQISDGRTEGLRVLNNIFVDRSTGSSYAMSVADTTGNTFDYNLYLSAINRIIRANSTNFADLTAWKATGYGAHSVSFLPEIVSPQEDLHLTETEDGNTDLIGAYLEQVPLDIDRQDRNSELPYIGADERSPFPGGRPIARDDVATTFEETALAIDVLSNDLDPDGGSLRVADVSAAGTIGTVELDSEGTGVTYTPADGFIGRDRFTYTVRDEDDLPDDAAVIVNVISKPADLIVDQVQAPPEALSGREAELSWTVTNAGTGSTSAPEWYDEVWLSTGTGGGVAHRLGQVKNPSFLRAGESYTTTHSFTIPPGVEGDFFVFVETDRSNRQAESDDTNNRGRTPETVDVSLPALPDLQVALVDVPSDGLSGQSLAVSYTVTNEGDGVTDASTWHDAVIFSPDFNLVTEDQWRGGDAKVLRRIRRDGALSAGESYPVNTTVTLPHAISGEYYIFVLTDLDGKVFEHVLEGNNNRADTVQVTLSPAPDFVPTVLETSETVESGQTIAVSWTVENRGDGPPFEDSWFDRIYLSESAEFDRESAVVLASKQRDGSLGPGASYSAEAAVTLPEGVSGTYHLFVESDAVGSVFENDREDNNLISQGRELNVTLAPPPNLRVTAVEPPAQAVAGERIVVSWSVANDGDAPTKTVAWEDRLYASTDESLASGALLLAEVERTGPLANGASYTAVTDVGLPTDLASGTYRFFVETDARNAVYEHDSEDDNVGNSSDVGLSAYPPVDLVVEELNVPDETRSGETVTVTFDVRNDGSGRTLSGQWADAIYLSTDSLLDTNADTRLLRRERRQALDGSDRYQRSESVTLPDGISGNYVLYAASDVDDRVTEVNESNNVAVRAISITETPPPDLRVTGLDVTSPGQAGQPVTVRWTVENQGVGSTQADTWYEAIYLSTFEVIDRSAKRLATYERAGFLEPDSSYTDSLEVTLPAYASGSLFMLFETDTRDDLYEGDGEPGNVVAVPLTVVLPQPADLIVPSVNAPATAVPGDVVTIDYAVENQGSHAAVGHLIDAIYVSEDQTWDLEDPLLGVQARKIDLAPGASMKVSTQVNLGKAYAADEQGNMTGEVPGVLPGSYHVIARTDIRNHIRETEEGNNLRSSSSQVDVTIPLLEPGEPIDLALSDGQRRYYRILVGEEEDLRVQLSSSTPGMTGEIYVAHERTALPSDFDFAATDTEHSDQDLLVPARLGTHYVLVVGRGGEGGSFTLRADVLPFAVLSITPDEGGAGGRLTTDVRGAGFRESTTFALRGSDGTLLAPASSNVLRSTEARAVWNLPSSGAGTYDVVARNDGDEARLEDGFGVGTALPLEVDVTLSAPEGIRAAGGGLFTYVIENKGNVDIPYFEGMILMPYFTEVLSVHTEGLETEVDKVRSVLLYLEERGMLEEDTYEVPDQEHVQVRVDGIDSTVVAVPVRARNVSPGERLVVSVAVRGFPSGDSFPITFSHQSYTAWEYLSLLADAVEQRRGAGLDLENPSDEETALLQDPSALREDVLGFMAAVGLVSDEDVASYLASAPPAGAASAAATGSSGTAASVGPPAGAGPSGEESSFVPDFTASSYGVGAVASSAMDRCIFWEKVTCFFISQAVCFAISGAGNIPVLVLQGTVRINLRMICSFPISQVCNTLTKKWCQIVLQSMDPNDIVGPAGFGDERWIARDEEMPYTIRFENDPEEATAPAQVVSVTQQLDSTLDLQSFRLGRFGFRGMTFDVPEGRSHYQERLDVRDSTGLYVDFSAGIDYDSREAYWRLESVDPATGQLPWFDGFLPPNDTLGMGTGEGFLSYTVRPKADAATLDEVQAEARIVFDVNEPIDTPPILNTIDAEPPVGFVTELPAEIDSSAFDVRWSPDDFGGSGVRQYALYVSKADGPFELYRGGIEDTSTVFHGDYEASYSFFVLATDHTGQVEPMESEAEASVVLVTPTAREGGEELPKVFALEQNYPNPFNPSTAIRFALPEAAHVSVDVFDVIGRRIAVLIEREDLQAGWHELQLNASTWASGVYFYRIRARGDARNAPVRFMKARKMVLVK